MTAHSVWGSYGAPTLESPDNKGTSCLWPGGVSNGTCTDIESALIVADGRATFGRGRMGVSLGLSALSGTGRCHGRGLRSAMQRHGDCPAGWRRRCSRQATPGAFPAHRDGAKLTEDERRVFGLLNGFVAGSTGDESNFALMSPKRVDRGDEDGDCKC